MSVYKASFTEQLRRRTKVALGVCPTCGQPTETSIRDAAALVGLSHTTLWRFLKGSKPSAAVIDTLVDWLEARGA